jgi:hypothetical protein
MPPRSLYPGCATPNTEYRLSSPCDSHEPLLESVCMGSYQAQNRIEHMRLMATNSMGGVQTITAQFFDWHNGTLTVGKLHSHPVFYNAVNSSH